jgi:hypothetical protein
MSPTSAKSTSKADSLKADTIAAKCLKCVCYKGGTCCEIVGDTVVVSGNSFIYRYEHNKTKLDSINWNVLNGDPNAVVIHTSDSIATISFLSNFTACILHAYAKGAGWACEDILRIKK